MKADLPIEQRLAALLNGQGYALRLKVRQEFEPEAWGKWLGVPVPGYLEINGPWPLRRVEWVEVDPVVTTGRGRLGPPLVENHLSSLATALSAAAIPFALTDDGYLRILLSRQ